MLNHSTEIEMEQDHSKRTKVDALVADGTLNASANKVRDPKFREGEFFDPRDLVQVKYEMLRRVLVENTSVTHASKEYGMSRPTYYQAKAHFSEEGIAGLAPKKRGPRGPHKLDNEVLIFLKRQLVLGQPIRARELARRVQEELGIHLHPRTIERALAGKKKLGLSAEDTQNKPVAESAASRYETLRMAALGEPVPPEGRSGLVVFLRRGMWGWTRALPAQITPQQRPPSTSPTSTEPHQRKAAIQLLATIAAPNKWSAQ
jgi:transposase